MPDSRSQLNLRRNQDGYILITMLLLVALLSISLIAVVRKVEFDVRRDRESEMIHRGVQYSRAIRLYYKKFNRYPTRLEELENTSNIRYLRKRYKDPVTGQDFKLLHFGEVRLNLGAGLLPGVGAGAPGGLPGLPGGLAGNVAGLAGNVGPGGIAQVAQAAQAAALAQAGNSGAANLNPGDPNADPNAAPDQNGGGPQAGQPGGGGPGGGAGFGTAGSGVGQAFGGGPIVGVASLSKKETIREFNHKNHYKDWQFIYDPGSDRGGLISTPSQPPLTVGTVQPGQAGQPGQPGAGGTVVPPGGTNFNPPNFPNNNPPNPGDPGNPPHN